MSIRTIIRMRSVVSLVAAAVCFLAIMKGQETKRFTGTYTNMQYNAEGGDLLGEEIKIVWTDHGYQGALQFAEGGAGPLMIVVIHINTNKIEFTLPESSRYAGSFRGTIADGVIHGAFAYKNGGTETVTLKKGKSYWD